MAYIIDRFNRFDGWDREHSVYNFEVNGVQYAIFEVEMEWGLPKVPVRIDRNKCAHEYQVYGNVEDARKFVQMVKELAR